MYLAMAVFIWRSGTGQASAIDYRAACGGKRLENYGFAPTGVASSGCTCDGATGSGASFSQSQPSFKQVCTRPILVFFSTMKGAPHLGHGSGIGINGVVKSQSG